MIYTPHPPTMDRAACFEVTPERRAFYTLHDEQIDLSRHRELFSLWKEIKKTLFVLFPR